MEATRGQLSPTDPSLCASSIKPFEMCAIRTGRRSTVQRPSVSIGIANLSYWCEIAQLDLNSVIVRARTLMADCDTSRRSRAGSAEVH